MPKLASPVQYESALDGLNTIRPLQLADVGKIVLPTPVLCKNPPNRDNPAVGLLARCTQQGALLKSNGLFANKIYADSFNINTEENNETYVFPSKVYGVLAKHSELEEETYCYWCSNDFQDIYISISTHEWLFLPFVGRRICFFVDAEEDWETVVTLIGFYK